MTHTYHKMYYHLIWATKDRQPLIHKSCQERLYEYLGGTFRAKKCTPIQIGGMPDHIHILLTIPPSIAVSDLIHDAKITSTRWIRDTFPEGRDFSWQEGFGGYSVSHSVVPDITSYIKNQEQHHKSRDFKSEFIGFVEINDIEFKEEYLWK